MNPTTADIRRALNDGLLFTGIADYFRNRGAPGDEGAGVEGVGGGDGSISARDSNAPAPVLGGINPLYIVGGVGILAVLLLRR